MAPHGSSNKGKWLWSEEQRKYYRFELDGNGGYLRDGAGMMCLLFSIAKV
jgi:hypothetical protein